MRGLIVLGLLLTVTGCGASAQQEVAAVIRASDAAFERGDLDEGCSLMTERARKEYLRYAINPGADTCSEAYKPVEVAPGPEVAHLYVNVVEQEPLRMTRIRVTGDTAVASYSNGLRERLRKIDGRWLIDSYD